MSLRDVILLLSVCIVLGLNLVVTRWVVADAGVPPILFAGLRFLGVAIVLFWCLRPLPKNLGMLFLIAMGMGAVNFALMFTGLVYAEASAVAVVAQLGVPMMTIMGVIFLGEKIGWRRGAGILLAFAGSFMIAFNPATFSFSLGLILVVLAVLASSSAGILMKKMPPIGALQMQAWIALFSFLPLLLVSGLFEGDQNGLDTVLSGGWMVWSALAFAILLVSVFAQAGFYYLLKTYEVSLINPLMIMAPIWSVILGVLILDETLTLQLLIGAAISLGGVFVILIRPGTPPPDASLSGNMAGAPPKKDKSPPALK
ncbi:MAG: DMT family transporter [Henriciella sp.]